MVLGLCDRFHKLPSEVLAEPLATLRLMAIEARGRPAGTEEGGGW